MIGTTVAILVSIVCLMKDSAAGIKVLAEGSVARERVDAIFLRCDVINLDQEDEIVRVTWRHNDTTAHHGAWNEVFTVDLTNDVPAYFFFSQWAGRGQYNPISLATVMLSPAYVTRYSSGTYRCDVETANTRGHAQATVNVYYGPGTSIVISPGGRVQKTEGEELTLSCHAECNPNCSYRWYKSGRRLSSSSRLHMTSVSRQEGGLYACQARNEVGRSIKPVDIRVLYPPEVLDLALVTPESNINVTIRSRSYQQTDIVLQCRIQSWPESEVLWFKGSNRLQNTTHAHDAGITTWSVNFEHKISRLTIKNATCLDNGVYSCKARNSIGESVARHKNVTQDCSPYEVFDSELCPAVASAAASTRHLTKGAVGEMEKKLGDEVSFRFCFTGHPTPDLQITRLTTNSEKVQNIRNVPGIVCNDEPKVCVLDYSFIVTSPLQYGKYEVKVTNKLHSFVKVYRIVSRQAPVPPTRVAMTTVTSTSVCISWHAGYDGGSEQTFKVTYWIVDSNSDGADDKTTTMEVKSVTVRVNLDSGIRSNRGSNALFEDINNPYFQFPTPGSHSHRHKARRETRMKTKTTNFHTTTTTTSRLMNKLKTGSTTNSISSCIAHLIPSVLYSVRVEAFNMYGISRASDELHFKTLDIPTTEPPSTSSSSLKTTTTTTVMPSSSTIPTEKRTLSSSTTGAINLIRPTTAVPNTKSPPRRFTSSVTHSSKISDSAILADAHRRVGDFEHARIHDEDRGADDTFPGKLPVFDQPPPSNSNSNSNSDNVPNYFMRGVDDDHNFWNSQEDSYHNVNNNNNNNNINNNINKNNNVDIMNDPIVSQSHSAEENSDDGYDDGDDDDDDDIYDADAVYEESRLLVQALFPYFRSILFHKDININNQLTIPNQKNTHHYPLTPPPPPPSPPPPGPFEVERYFKKYNHVKKRKHIIPIASDSLLPFNNNSNTRRNPYAATDNRNRQGLNTKRPVMSISTHATPTNDSFQSVVASSLSIASVLLLIVVIVTAVTLKFMLRRRRRRQSRKRSQDSKSSWSSRSQLTTTTGGPASVIPSISTIGGRTRTRTISYSRPSVVANYPNVENARSEPHVNTTSRVNNNNNNNNNNNPALQTVESNNHNNNGDKFQCPKGTGINNRPRLSTPKAYRRDRRLMECSYTHYNESSSASSKSDVKRQHPTTLRTTTNRVTKQPPPNPPSDSRVNNNNNQQQQQQQLTIPGISVNDKRISSPSYLELCSGIDTSYESSCQEQVLPQVCQRKGSLSDNKSSADDQSIEGGSGKLDALSIRRSSYSSVIIPGDVNNILNNNDDNPDRLDPAAHKWNSYLDLCEALSVKSGSRSPSNIYDPLDIADKISIRSVASYMSESQHTPELARKILEENYLNPSTPSCLGHDTDTHHHQHNSPQEIKRNFLNKRKLCQEASESDNSSHYEKCVSLTYDDEVEIEQIKATIKKERNEIKIDETVTDFATKTTLCVDSTKAVVEYMNETNDKLRLPNSSVSTWLNNGYNQRLSTSTINDTRCDQGVENDNSFYNEIDALSKTNDQIDSSAIVRMRNGEQLQRENGKIRNAGTKLDKLKLAGNGKESCPIHRSKSPKCTENPTMSNCLDECTSFGTTTKSEKSQRFMDTNCVEYASPKARHNNKGTVKATTGKRGEKSRKNEEVSRQDSSSHYYSDIDTKD